MKEDLGHERAPHPSRSSVTEQSWQPIETAPKMKVILLWAVTDIGPNGEVRNWKMATGCRYVASGGDEWWEWDGRTLKDYDIQPTHWRPMPAPPHEERTMTAQVEDKDANLS